MDEKLHCEQIGLANLLPRPGNRLRSLEVSHWRASEAVGRQQRMIRSVTRFEAVPGCGEQDRSRREEQRRAREDELAETLELLFVHQTRKALDLDREDAFQALGPAHRAVARGRLR